MVDKNSEGKEDLPYQDLLMIFTGVANNDFFVEVDNFGFWKVENQRDKQTALGSEGNRMGLDSMQTKSNKGNNKNYDYEEKKGSMSFAKPPLRLA
ncbi:7350_t:CDS:2 [Entrophospora sp. SA101]|nr:7350_t:CDS:2 [Entrophospora sp. SA101]CAJ0886149.1 1201_t:CDS:2 [Entrophospora sp. SA101]